MGSFYADSNEVSVLRERIEELGRIRQGFATHLGSSLYEATKDNPELRWGRESLYDGISACDSERDRLLKRIQELNVEPSDENVTDTEPCSEPVPVPEPEPEPAPIPEPAPELASEPEFDGVSEFEPVPAPEPLPAPEPISVPEPEPAPVSEPAVTAKLELDKTTVNPVMPEKAPESPKCPSCGASVRPGDMFCMTCGTNLSEAQKKQSNVCPHCGAPIEPGFKFCMTCGKSLK